MSDNRKSSAPANMGAELAEYDRQQQLASMPGAVWSRGPRKGIVTRKATTEERAAHAKLLADGAGDADNFAPQLAAIVRARKSANLTHWRRDPDAPRTAPQVAT